MLTQLPENDRPRERLLNQGAEALSTVELVAILLGSGFRGMPVLILAQELLLRFGSLQQLAEATFSELCEVKGIGPAKAIQLKAAVTLGARALRPIPKSKILIQTPAEAYNLIKSELISETRELFFALLLDAKGHLICQEIVSIGTLTSTLVHPRELFYPAIRHKAASLIIAHNHPSGDLTPSDEDLKITRTLIKVGKLMEIPLLDHLIISSTGFCSLKQKGLF